MAWHGMAWHGMAWPGGAYWEVACLEGAWRGCACLATPHKRTKLDQATALPPHLPNAQISMYINSPGGVVTAGLAIYDTMQYIRAPVATLAVRCTAAATCTPLVYSSSSGSISSISYCRAAPCKANAMQLDAMSLHGSGLRSAGQAAIMGPCCCSRHAARQKSVSCFHPLQVGQAASMASLLLAAGEPGHRRILPHR